MAYKALSPRDLNSVPKSDFVSSISGLSATLAASGTDESDTIELNTAGETELVVQIACTFNALATGDLTVKLLTSLDGTSFDDASDPLASGSIPVQAGATARKTFLFQVLPPYARIRLENGDSTYSITGISGSFYAPPA